MRLIMADFSGFVKGVGGNFSEKSGVTGDFRRKTPENQAPPLDFSGNRRDILLNTFSRNVRRRLQAKKKFQHGGLSLSRRRSRSLAPGLGALLQKVFRNLPPRRPRQGHAVRLHGDAGRLPAAARDSRRAAARRLPAVECRARPSGLRLPPAARSERPHLCGYLLRPVGGTPAGGPLPLRESRGAGQRFRGPLHRKFGDSA